MGRNICIGDYYKSKTNTVMVDFKSREYESEIIVIVGYTHMCDGSILYLYRQVNGPLNRDINREISEKQLFGGWFNGEYMLCGDVVEYGLDPDKYKYVI